MAGRVVEAISDLPVPVGRSEEERMEAELDEAIARLGRELKPGKKGYYGEVGRTTCVNVAMMGALNFWELSLGMVGWNPRTGLLSINPQWVTPRMGGRETLGSYEWPSMVDEVVRTVKGSPSVESFVGAGLDKFEAKTGVRMDAGTRQGIVRFVEQSAVRRMGANRLGLMSGAKEFSVAQPVVASSSRVAEGEARSWDRDGVLLVPPETWFNPTVPPYSTEDLGDRFVDGAPSCLQAGMFGDPSRDVGWKVPVYEGGVQVALYRTKAATAGEARRKAMDKAKADGKEYKAGQFGKPQKVSGFSAREAGIAERVSGNALVEIPFGRGDWVVYDKYGFGGNFTNWPSGPRTLLVKDVKPHFRDGEHVVSFEEYDKYGDVVGTAKKDVNQTDLLLKRFEKIPKPQFSEKPNPLSVSAVKALAGKHLGWFDEEGEMSWGTREHGDVGAEEPGREDLRAAQEFKRAVLGAFPGHKVDVEAVDEWVSVVVVPAKGAGVTASSRTASMDRTVADSFASGMESVAFVAEAVVNDYAKVSSNPDQYEVDIHVYLDASAQRPGGFTQMMRREAQRIADRVGAKVTKFFSPRMDRDVARGSDLARFYAENPYKIEIVCRG